MRNMPHPEVMPAEGQDWRPLLDRELSLLPQKYRAAIVMCDLEGRTRKEAARLLKVPEGTLSSRLATGRQMLAKRLARCGVALSGGALAVALAQATASAQVSAALVTLTTKSAVLVGSGQLAGVSTSAVLLMREVMKSMLLKKLRLAVGTVMVLVALGAVGLGYQAAGGFGTAQAAPPEKPRNELEALRRENELLKLNLEVVLEKVRAQEAELRAARGREAALLERSPLQPEVVAERLAVTYRTLKLAEDVADPVQQAEAALKALREAKDPEGKRRATEALERAVQKLKQQAKPEGKPEAGPDKEQEW
jgi:hypothetical protein